MEKTNSILNGDCIDLLYQIDEGSIACCITDPPYNYEFVGRSWDDDEISRRRDRVKDENSSTLVKNLPYGSGLAGGVRNRNWYQRNRENDLEYIKWCEEWSKGLFRVCKDGAPVAVFNSSRSIAHVQIALESAGFYTRDILVYRRNAGIPKGLNLEAKLRKMGSDQAENWKGWHSAFRNEWEAILLVQKPLINNYWETLQHTGVGVFKTINPDGTFQSNIIDKFTNRNKEDKFEHCTVKPLDLIIKLIDMLVPPSKDHIILDPFAGSGTTLVAAKTLGYKYIGFEIEGKYIEMIKKRLDSVGIQNKLF
jgi:site-specific DNA-methyltransferase (adenine-specific)